LLFVFYDGFCCADHLQVRPLSCIAGLYFFQLLRSQCIFFRRVGRVHYAFLVFSKTLSLSFSPRQEFKAPSPRWVIPWTNFLVGVAHFLRFEFFPATLPGDKSLNSLPAPGLFFFSTFPLLYQTALRMSISLACSPVPAVSLMQSPPFILTFREKYRPLNARVLCDSPSPSGQAYEAYFPDPLEISSKELDVPMFVLV